MMKSEFESLAGRNVTDEQYKAIETLYMSSNLEKAEFVKSIRTMLKSIPQPEKKKDIKRMVVRDRSGYRKTPNGCYYHIEYVELVDIDIKTGKYIIKPLEDKDFEQLAKDGHDLNLNTWIAKKTKATRNAMILKVADEMTKGKEVVISTIDSLKDVFNVGLDPAITTGAMVIANQNGYNYLDKLKDKDGKYILQPNPTQPTQMMLFGKYPIVKVSNRTVKSEPVYSPAFTISGSKLAIDGTTTAIDASATSDVTAWKVVKGKYVVTCKGQEQETTVDEKYTALQAGLENTIVFKVRNCKRMKEVRKKMKEFYAEYDGTRFDIYDASPMFTDNGWVLVKCRAVA